MSFAYNKGVAFRSRGITYGAGQSTNFDLSFLQSPMARMGAPVVRELVFEFAGSISGTTGGFVGDDACMIYSKIEIRDKGGVIHDLPGKQVRNRMLIEFGQRGQEDADGIGTAGDVASGATNASYRFFLRVPFDLEQACNGADTALPLLHLVDGGEVLVTFNASNPTNSTVNSGTVTLYAIVHDEKVKELKSRLVTKQFAVTLIEADYTLNGSTRILALTSNPAGTGYTDWTVATFPTIDVPELELSNFSVPMLRSEYSRLRPFRATDDTFVTGGPDGIPLIFPSSGQRIDKMPDLKSVRVRLPAAAVTSAQLLTCWIEDRYIPLAAQWLGFSDMGQYIETVNSRGKVKLSGGGVMDPALLGAMAKRYPIVID